MLTWGRNKASLICKRHSETFVEELDKARIRKGGSRPWLVRTREGLRGRGAGWERHGVYWATMPAVMGLDHAHLPSRSIRSHKPCMPLPGWDDRESWRLGTK